MFLPRIRELREDHDLNIQRNTYSDYERGEINIPIEQLIKLADFYDVSLDYLVGRDWPKKKK